MEKIFRFFTERHLLATSITVAILLVGIVTLTNIRKDLFPRVKLNNVSILTVYPGASPADVEFKVTNKIEKHLGTVEGIEKMQSFSIENMSIITLRVDEEKNEREVERVVQNIREAVSQINDFPTEVETRPSIERDNDSLLPIIAVGIGGKVPFRDLRKYSKILEKKIRDLPGVAEVNLYGYRSREITIEVLPDKMSYYQVPIVEIVDSVQKRNTRATIGKVETDRGSKTIITESRIKEPNDIGDIIVRSNFEEPSVYIKNLARIRDGYEEQDVIPRINGQKVIYLSIRKKENADIVETVNAIKELIEREEETLPEALHIQYSNDLSRYVTAGFNVVSNNAVFGFFLVMIMLTAFMSFRVSVWVALGIPVSLLGAIALLPLFDVCLDVITMSAMILILGIIVDDAIVIAERIYFWWENGKKPVEAAVLALKDVFWPVVTTVISTLLAFVPMFIIPGDIGKFIFVIPLVITLALLISLVEGIVALPAHVAHDIEKGKGRNFDKENFLKRMMSWLTRKHQNILKRILKKKFLVIGVFTAMLISSFVYALTMKIIVFPTEGAEEFAIYMETPVGTTLQETSKVVRDVEKAVMKMSSDEVSSFTTYVGNQEGIVNQANIAAIRVDLTPYSNRERNADMIVEDLRKKTSKIKGFERIVFDVSDTGPNPEKPIAMRVTSNDNKLRDKLAGDIVYYLESIEGVKDIDRDDMSDMEQVKIVFNHKKMREYGLDAANVSYNLRALWNSAVVAKVQLESETVKIKIRYPKYARKNINKLLHVKIPNRETRLIPLYQFAHIEKVKSPAMINHYKRERAIYITARVDDKKNSPENVNKLVSQHFNISRDYQGAALRIGGQQEQTDDSMEKIKKTFIIAVIGIYLLLVLLFNSVTQPLLILLSVPFGIMGVIFIFATHGEPISFMGMLGVIGLCGVLVNDEIILVDHLNKLLKENPDEPVIDLIARGAAERFRPIAITTITTAAGLLPLAYGIGGSDPVTAPMALALGWGLLLETPLTLILIPCFYLVYINLKEYFVSANAFFKRLLSFPQMLLNGKGNRD